VKKAFWLVIVTLLSLSLDGCPNEVEADTGADTATLIIKNQSFSDLMDVQWQGVTFRANSIENSVPVGNSVERKVKPGSAYIFFKRKSNPAFARTKEALTLGEHGTEEFVFIDNTLIVEANNPDNTGTLKDMPTTVVFFDNAEGEIQNYTERKGSAYYSDLRDLPYSYLNADYTRYTLYAPPYTGVGRSIALGGVSDARLRLTLTLERKAKFSFWYANRGGAATLSIDGTWQMAWTDDYNWSYQEYTLDAGFHEIEWTKDGFSSGYTYLSLDNIWVVYTE
jgi:hypothetical protein